MSDTRIDVHLHFHDLERIVPLLVDRSSALLELFHLVRELKAMSTSLSQQLDAATQTIQTGISQLSTDVSAVAAEVNALLAGVTTGSTITQAQVDKLTAIASSVTALDSTVQGILSAGGAGTTTSAGVTTGSAARDPSE